MSRQAEATDLQEGLGPFLRHLRESRGLALWQVAGAATMDSTLLSKIELGHRLPTQEQSALLAKFFEIPIGEIEGRRITAKFWREHGGNPSVGEAVQKIQETAPGYLVNKSVNRKGKGTG